MHMVPASMKLSRKPDLIDRQVNEKYDLGVDLDRPRNPTGTARIAASMFCESITSQRFAVLMRDDGLRAEMRKLLQDAPLVREIFADKQPVFLTLIDTDPPALHLAAQHGQTL